MVIGGLRPFALFEDKLRLVAQPAFLDILARASEANVTICTSFDATMGKASVQIQKLFLGRFKEDPG